MGVLRGIRERPRASPASSGPSLGFSRALVAGVGGGRRWRASRRSRRRSRTKTPVSLIKATKTRHRSKQRKQRTAHPELTRVINHQTCAYTPHRLQVAREPGRRRRRQRNMMDEGILDGGDMPTGTRTGPQIGSLTRKKRRKRFFFLRRKISRTRANQTQGEPPQTTKTGEDRPHDHTLSTHPLTHTQTTERDLTSPIRWLGGPLLAGGAAEVGACASYDGFRDGSGPSRPPHGHARCSRRGHTRLRGREPPPAQLQVGARDTSTASSGTRDLFR